MILALLFVLTALWLPMSRDPEARKRSMANLHNAPPAPTGNRRALKHGSRSKAPPVNLREARAQIEKIMTATGPPLYEDDGTPNPTYTLAVKVTTAKLARYDYITDYIDRVGPMSYTGKLRYSPLRELRRLEKEIMQHLHELGLTPRGRYAMGLDAAQTQVALEHIRPNRDPEHLMKVAVMLQRNGMLPTPPPPDAEVVEAEVHEAETDSNVRRLK